MIYLLSFAIHFAVLTNTGPGDAQMSSLFQANLRGTEVGMNSPLEVAYGSMATIKNMGYGGGLLHRYVPFVQIVEVYLLMHATVTSRPTPRVLLSSR